MRVTHFRYGTPTDAVRMSSAAAAGGLTACLDGLDIVKVGARKGDRWEWALVGEGGGGGGDYVTVDYR